jgi:hypothetical protein
MVNLVTLGFARFQRHEGDRIVCDESLPIVAAIVWLQQSGKLAQAILAQYWDAPIAPVRGCIYEILVGLLLAMLYSGIGPGRPFTESLKFPGDIPPWAQLRARSVALRKRGADLVVEYRDLPRAGPSRCFPAPWFFRSASSDETISFLEGLSNDGAPILIPDPNHHGDLLMPFLLENGVVMVMVIQCKDYARDLSVEVLLKAIDSVTPIFAFLNKDGVCCIEYPLSAALVLMFFVFQAPFAPVSRPNENAKYLAALEGLEKIKGSGKLEMVDNLSNVRHSDRIKEVKGKKKGEEGEEKGPERKTYNALRVLALRPSDERVLNGSLFASDPHPFATLDHSAFNQLKSEFGLFIPEALLLSGWEASETVFSVPP